MTIIYPNYDMTELDKAYNEIIWIYILLIMGSILLPILVLSWIDDWKNRNKPPLYKLKRTKNPYRRYKRVYY